MIGSGNMSLKLSSRLFLTALLPLNPGLDHDQRAQIIGACPLEEYADEKAIMEWLAEWSRQAWHERPTHQKSWPTPKHLETARVLARMWQNAWVKVIIPENPGWNPQASQVHFAWGNLSLLDAYKTAIINSRKPAGLTPHDRWLKVSIQMVEQAVSKGWAIISSLGARHYELVSYLAARPGSALIIVCEGPLPLMLSQKELDSFIRTYIQLIQPGRILLISPFSPGKFPRAFPGRFIRDACVVGLADRLFVAEIRAGGQMEGLAREAFHRRISTVVFRPDRFDNATKGNRTLLDLGATPWQPSGLIVTGGPVTSTETTELVTVPESPASRFLVHFTRSAPGPWPGQDLGDYYRALIDGENDAGHTAFDTLKRVLTDGLIKGSGRLIRGGYRVVSFTSGRLDRLSSLIHWRRTLRRWNLEPYGLAISRNVLMRLGATPVIYGGLDIWRRLPPKWRFRFQSAEPNRTDWSGEKEWRLSGDLDLTDIPQDDLRAIVPCPSEAEEIMSRFGIKAILAADLDPKYMAWRARQGK